MLEKVALHDAVLRRAALDVASANLVLEFDGYCRTDEAAPGSVRLVYTGVSAVEENGLARYETALNGSAGLGDMGYDEIDDAGQGFEHRFLFSTGIKLAVRFTDVAVHPEPDGERK